MTAAQGGVFALGTASHAYLEFDALPGSAGIDGFSMPATQHDAVLWLSGSAYDVVFEASRGAIAALRAIASVAEETSSWPYMHDRDLTGFIDGSENPTLVEAPTSQLSRADSGGQAGRSISR